MLGQKEILCVEGWANPKKTFKPKPTEVTMGDYIRQARGRFGCLRDDEGRNALNVLAKCDHDANASMRIY